MTVGVWAAFSKHDFAFSRRVSRPSCASSLIPPTTEGAGKAGRWPRPWPASNKKSWRQSPQVWPESPSPPCAMVLRLIRDLPGARALLPPSSAGSSLADLTPASGCQDHTISSSASAPFVRAKPSRAPPKRPSHPAPNVRDDREAPLMASTGRAHPISDLWKRQADFHKSETAHCDKPTRRAVCACRSCAESRMGRAQRNPSCHRGREAMGFASLYPSYNLLQLAAQPDDSR